MNFVRFLPLVISLFAACIESTCYHPNGDEAPNDTPCYPDQTNSTCCGAGLACLSNNLCGVTQYPSDPKGEKSDNTDWFVRGTCTDKSWKDKSCLQYCLKSNQGDFYNVWVPVRQCLSGKRDRWYCANPRINAESFDSVCFQPSDTDKQYLFQADGNPSTITIIGHQLDATGTTSPSSTASSSSGIASATTTPSSSSSSTSSSISPSNSTSSPGSVAQKKPDYSVPIGVGVGVPLGLLVSGLLGLLYLRHRRQNLLAAANDRLHQEKLDQMNAYPQPTVYEHRSELSERAITGELSTNPDPHELAAEHWHA